eukprot:403331308
MRSTLDRILTLEFGISTDFLCTTLRKLWPTPKPLDAHRARSHFQSTAVKNILQLGQKPIPKIRNDKMGNFDILKKQKQKFHQLIISNITIILLPLPNPASFSCSPHQLFTQFIASRQAFTLYYSHASIKHILVLSQCWITLTHRPFLSCIFGFLLIDFSRFTRCPSQFD